MVNPDPPTLSLLLPGCPALLPATAHKSWSSSSPSASGPAPLTPPWPRPCQLQVPLLLPVDGDQGEGAGRRDPLRMDCCVQNVRQVTKLIQYNPSKVQNLHVLRAGEKNKKVLLKHGLLVHEMKSGSAVHMRLLWEGPTAQTAASYATSAQPTQKAPVRVDEGTFSS